MPALKGVRKTPEGTQSFGDPTELRPPRATLSKILTTLSCILSYPYSAIYSIDILGFLRRWVTENSGLKSIKGLWLWGLCPCSLVLVPRYLTSQESGLLSPHLSYLPYTPPFLNLLPFSDLNEPTAGCFFRYFTVTTNILYSSQMEYT